MNYYFDIQDMDPSTQAAMFETFSSSQKNLYAFDSTLLLLYFGVIFCIYICYTYVSGNQETEQQSRTETSDDEEEPNDEPPQDPSEEDRESDDEDDDEDSTYSSECPDNCTFKLPAILHIHSSDEKTQGEIDNIAYALMSSYGLYNGSSVSPHSLYYNYHGDYYVIYYAELGRSTSTTLLGQGLTDELNDRYDVSLNSHCDNLIEFANIPDMVNYLNDSIANTMQKTIENLYENEIDYTVPQSIFKCTNTLYKNNILWDTLPDSNIYGKWIKISLSNNTGGYNMCDFTGILFRMNDGADLFKEFIESTELPMWYYCKLVNQLKSQTGTVSVDLHSENEDEDILESLSEHSSMPDLVSDHSTNDNDTVSQNGDDDQSEDASLDESKTQSASTKSSDQEESSTKTSTTDGSTDDEMPPLEKCSNNESANANPTRRISKRRTSFDSDYRIRSNFRLMRQLLENMRSKKILVDDQSVSPSHHTSTSE
jgi:hypothetical protein